MDVWDTGDDISALASILADPTRAKVCVTLMDGCAWTPGELAHQIDVSPQAMSSCLAHLEDAGAITRIRQGRHHYVRLSGEHMARIVESLGAAAGPRRAHPVGYRQVRADRRLQAARTCYTHIAGRLGVALADAMNAQGLIETSDDAMRLTLAGTAWFADQGIMLPTAQARIRACLDWTERRMHIAGPAGIGLCRRLLELDVIRRSIPRRALTVTPSGQHWFEDHLGLDAQAIAEPRP